MPCSDSNYRVEWEEEKYGTNDPDKLREMLCATLNILDNRIGVEKLPNNILEWYQKHKEWDKYKEKIGLTRV